MVKTAALVWPAPTRKMTQNEKTLIAEIKKYCHLIFRSQFCSNLKLVNNKFWRGRRPMQFVAGFDAVKRLDRTKNGTRKIRTNSIRVTFGFEPAKFPPHEGKQF